MNSNFLLKSLILGILQADNKNYISLCNTIMGIASLDTIIIDNLDVSDIFGV